MSKGNKGQKRAAKVRKRTAKKNRRRLGRSVLVNDHLPPSIFVSLGTVMPAVAEPEVSVVLEQTDTPAPPLNEELTDLLAEAEIVLADLHANLLTPTREADAAADRADDVIARIRDTPEADLCRVLGDYMGGQIKRFCETMDFDHPSLSVEVRQGFSPDSEFVATLRELFAFLDRSAGLDRVATLLKGTISKEKGFQEIRNFIYKPPSRCLKSAEARMAVRRKKTAKPLVVKEWFQNNQKGWPALSPAFRMYSRLSTRHETEAEQNRARAARLAALGAAQLAGTVTKRNDLFTDVVADRYCGFSKLRLLDAAVMLAKLHGAQYRADFSTLSYPRKVFGHVKFWLEAGKQFWGRDCSSPDADPTLEHGAEVDSYIPPESFTVAPRAYPLHEFAPKPPAATQGVLAAVETHPDAGHKPLFDQFWVVVPGVTVPEESFKFDNWWILRKGDSDTNHEFYREQAEIEKALDFYLTEQGGLVPVLLGEKDGRCYFLSMWR
jgi:hypothetical protein